ncbi:glycine cleavage T C-terminal barrel domain-containing protein [Cytobacillus praedii]|nr:glycine cleavage T C-terminal barrel domain-containing protein [Cytobacillus praedii]
MDLNKNIRLAIIDSKFEIKGTELEIKVRERKLKADIVKTPFYKRDK